MAIRAFLAIDLPDLLKEEVASLQKELRATGADVKWVELDALHLTLKFLGNIESDHVAILTERLSPLLRSQTAFQLTLHGIGAFPHTRYPRVIWVGVDEGKEAVTHLADLVESVCLTLGFAKEERAFHPHLTIGRIRSKDRLAPLIHAIERVQFRSSQPFEVERVTFFQSTLSPQGPLYTPLAHLPLKTTAARAES